MGNFWPDGFELTDTQSPREILQSAQEDWRTKSDGVVDLVLQDAESKSGNAMIVVHAKHVVSNRTATLLSILHRPNRPYPATIQLKDDDLPQFLKKSYRQPGSRGLIDNLANPMTTVYGEIVSNEWVSATPSEFREKLAKAFNLASVKSEILNLASVSSDNSE